MNISLLRAKPILLVIDANPDVAYALHASLISSGYEVHVAPTGKRGLELASIVEPDVVVLDLALPDIDGIEVCRGLRRWSTGAIVVLTGDDSEARKVQALDEGADDYVTKPFSTPELHARLRVALRHRRRFDVLEPKTLLIVGDLQLDVSGRQAKIGGETVRFTAKEFSLLSILAISAGQIVTHHTLIARVWPNDQDDRTNSLRVHVNQLRRKIGTGVQRPVVKSEQGIGYWLSVPANPTTTSPKSWGAADDQPPRDAVTATSVQSDQHHQDVKDDSPVGAPSTKPVST